MDTNSIRDFRATYPNTTADLPKQETYVMFEDANYYSDDGYPESGSHAHPYLKVITFKSLEALKAEIVKRTERNFKNENFSIAKLVPMRYNINIETAITLS